MRAARLCSGSDDDDGKVSITRGSGISTAVGVDEGRRGGEEGGDEGMGCRMGGAEKAFGEDGEVPILCTLSQCRTHSP